MFQRTFLRQAQRSLLSVRSTPATSAVRRTAQQPQLPQFARPLISQSAARLYSTENKAENGEQNGAAEEGEDACRKELEEKKKEIIGLKDQYLRSKADFINLQERTKRDMDNSRNFAIQRFAQDLLESIDNFDRAMLAVPKEKLEAAPTEANKDLLDLVSGLKMTQNVLMGTLKKHGLEQFDPSAPAEDGSAQKFDPNVHEAVFMTKVEGKEDGEIMFVQSKGFRLNGRVLRAAKVGVVKNN
ncbi:mitochondrial co-chaperone GrpE [Aspergillus japonicus CBS 114.51]|uniref:GrpE protein homolog n=2 Tax=Aspergillus TaxID=5052 RepID=A0A2V5HLR9_ASPV1|nr:mitochondrial co-chaperone GrpE [Aspergillus japonicus CBS 114.51]PYI24721.1 mitochondrial co-chaperone GrpE [Aspergillus violaceofuscus CBS 115571]RAH78337.1 mitochondrial co-chaperone GrpE [Aspergillus japonicus CBS 114.51]